MKQTKITCDFCESEIKEKEDSYIGMTEVIKMRIHSSAEFCSIECLKKWIIK